MFSFQSHKRSNKTLKREEMKTEMLRLGCKCFLNILFHWGNIYELKLTHLSGLFTGQTGLLKKSKTALAKQI